VQPYNARMCAKDFLFDPKAVRGPRREPTIGGASDGPAPAGRDVTAEFVEAAAAPLTVSDLLGRIKGALARALPQRLVVVGEISNLNLHSSGHVYFRLKDATGCIDAAMFRSAARTLRFTPSDGLEVVVEGRVDVYEVRGQLQFYVDRMTPRGQGSLELAFRQLRERLEREGLFDPSRKKPLPRFPRAVGIVTSDVGAAVRDIARTLGRRWPAARAYLMPTPVQGADAAESIARSLALLDANAERLGIDVIIVGRGGGSLEDLWAFNEEPVARAVFACRTPVISGVGHEVDVTICDLVADVRAATPTAAAELAVPDRADVARHLQAARAKLAQHVAHALARSRQQLDALLRTAVFRDPLGRLRTQAQRLDEISHRLRVGLANELATARRRLEPAANRLAALHPARLAERARAALDRLAGRMAWALGGRSKREGDRLGGLAGRLEAVHPRAALALARQKVESASRQLEALSYRAVLRRGFSVTRAGGRIVRSAGDIQPAQAMETEFADGRVRSTADAEPGPTVPPPASETPAARTRAPRKKPPTCEPGLFD